MDRQVHQRINDTGSIALEYALMLSFGGVFLYALLMIFEPGTGYTDLGKSLVAYFQRILVGISLPVP